MKARQEVLKALRGPIEERIERVRAFGEDVVPELLNIAFRKAGNAREADVEAARVMLFVLGPRLDLAPLVEQALVRRDYDIGSVLTRWGQRAVDAILAKYPELDGQGQFAARVMLTGCEVHDDRVLALLTEGVATGDPAGLLVDYGDPRGAAPIVAELRASPVRTMLSDAELERQMDLLDALEKLGGLPPDLAGRGVLLQALAARSLQDELHGQFEGKPRLVHAIEPLARSLTGTSGTLGVDGKPGRG